MNEFLKALIVDDDLSARSILTKYIETAGGVNIIGAVEDAMQAMDIIMHEIPDVIFLDINMPKENGLTFANRLQVQNIETQIVFTTAYHDYALHAFKLKPIDYLVKPFGINDVFDVITKVQQKLDRNKSKSTNLISNGKLKLKVNKGFLFVDPNEILFIEIDGSITKIVFNNLNEERVSYKLNEINELLKDFNFLKINRSVIVNLKKVKIIDKNNRYCYIDKGNEELKFAVSKPMLKALQAMGTIKIN